MAEKFEPFDNPADVVPPAASVKPTGFIKLEDDPTSLRGQEVTRERDRQTVGELISSNVAPVLQNLIRIYEDDPLSLIGQRRPGTEYNKKDFAKEMIPPHFNKVEAWAVLDEDTLEGAMDALIRIQEQQEKARVMMAGSPGAVLGAMAVGMLDIDAPLIVMSGQAYGALKTARGVLARMQKAGLRPGAAGRVASTAVGASGGFQAGLIVGVGDQISRDTAEWGDLAAMMLMATSAGATFGGVIPSFNRHIVQKAADAEFTSRIIKNEANATQQLDVEELISPLDHLGEKPPPQKGPVILGEDDLPVSPTAPKQKGPVVLDEADLEPPHEAINRVLALSKIKGTAEHTAVTGEPANTGTTLFNDVMRGADEVETLQKQISKLTEMLENQTAPKAKQAIRNRIVSATSKQEEVQAITLRKFEELEKAQDAFIAEMHTKSIRINKQLADDELSLGGLEPQPEVRAQFDARDAALEAGAELDLERMRRLGLVEADIESGLVKAAHEAKLILGGEPPKSLGAAATGTGGRPRRVIEDPAGPIPAAEAKVMDDADIWVDQTDFLQTRDQQATEWWARVATSQLGGFSTHNFHDLWKGKARVGNWIGGVIFESPSGLNRGRATSSALMEMYHRRIMHRIGGDFFQFSHRWAKEQGTTWRGSGYGISGDGKRAWSRELFLEMNDRALGKKGGRSEHIRGAADRLEASGGVGLEVLRGRKGQRAVDGFEDPKLGGVKDRTGYVPYRMDGFRINELMRLGVKMKDIERAFADGYRAAGMDVGKDADAVAKALIARARSNDFNFDTSMDTLLSGDGRQFLSESLRNSGMSDLEVNSLMQRLMGDQAEKGKESFAKRRNELDMTIEIKNDTGQTIQLVDLFDNDIDRIWQRYARQASGSAALARMGITNRAQRATVISALQAEQRAFGEVVSDTGLMEAMFSHFDAGPVWGFSGGAVNKGIGRVTATAKRMANIGLLEKLGITQLGELGAIIAMQGIESFYRRGIQPWFDASLRKADKRLLEDMSYITGEIGMDHRYYAEWLDLDDVGKQATATLMEKLAQNLSDYTSNAAFVQNYLNLFNTVRAGQQKLAMTGMVDKVFRELRSGNIESFAKRARQDLGLSIDDLETLRELMDDPNMVQWDPSGKFVNRVFFENWDQDFADTFGSALTRNMNQVVQKSMAGEQDAWMHTGWGSIMTHLLTFPLAAFQKQFLRNAQHLDLQAFAAMSQGMLTATIAIHIRDVVDGRDATLENRIKRAFNYNNLSSWMPMIWDPITAGVGQDDWRWNQFGPNADLTPVVFTQLNDLRRAPGAIINGLTGADEFDYFDRQALKAIPFAGTFFLSRALDKSNSKPVPSSRNLSDILSNPGVKAAIKKADGGHKQEHQRQSDVVDNVFRKLLQGG